MSKRKLMPELIEEIDYRLRENTIAQQSIINKDARTLMVEVAKCLVGIREETGHNDGRMVELIQKTVGGKKGYAWCAYFVQTCIAYAELKTGLKSKIIASGSCAAMRKASTSDMKVARIPLPGAIVLWLRKNGTGHTGVVVASDENIFYTCEGNTSQGLDPDGKVEREGQGSYYCKRDRRSSDFWGFLKPCFE